MLADQAQQIKILFRRLLHKFSQHFRLGIRAQHYPDLFIPGRIDLIQIAGTRVNQFFENAPLLLHAGDRQLRALERIENAEKVLPLAKNDLRGARVRAFFLLLVLNQVGTSHCLVAPAQSLPHLLEGLGVYRSIRITRHTKGSNRFFVVSANYVPRARCGKVWCEPRVPDVQLRSRKLIRSLRLREARELAEVQTPHARCGRLYRNLTRIPNDLGISGTPGRAGALRTNVWTRPGAAGGVPRPFDERERRVGKEGRSRWSPY